MTAFDPLKTTGFVIGRVVRALNVRVAKALETANVTHSVEEISVLTVINHIEPPQRISELAALVCRDPSTLSRQLEGLTEAELIRRERCPDDGRAVVIAITPKGRKLIERLNPLLLSVRAEVQKGITKSEDEQFVRTLFKMLNNLRDEPEET